MVLCLGVHPRTSVLKTGRTLSTAMLSLLHIELGVLYSDSTEGATMHAYAVCLSRSWFHAYTVSYWNAICTVQYSHVRCTLSLQIAELLVLYSGNAFEWPPTRAMGNANTREIPGNQGPSLKLSLPHYGKTPFLMNWQKCGSRALLSDHVILQSVITVRLQTHTHGPAIDVCPSVCQTVDCDKTKQ